MINPDDGWEPPEEWGIVYEHGESNTATYVLASELGMIDAAVTAYLESGGTRDSLLCLRMIEGEDYHMPASQVRGFFLSTPEFRLRNARQLKWQREENRTVRAALGLPYKEDDD